MQCSSRLNIRGRGVETCDRLLNLTTLQAQYAGKGSAELGLNSIIVYCQRCTPVAGRLLEMDVVSIVGQRLFQVSEVPVSGIRRKSPEKTPGTFPGLRSTCYDSVKLVTKIQFEPRNSECLYFCCVRSWTQNQSMSCSVKV